jgi:hypothetical protein
MDTTQCSICKRLVTVADNGTLTTHGPGPDGEFVCGGSGDRSMVKAAAHIRIRNFDECGPDADADPGL